MSNNILFPTYLNSVVFVFWVGNVSRVLCFHHSSLIKKVVFIEKFSVLSATLSHSLCTIVKRTAVRSADGSIRLWHHQSSWPGTGTWPGVLFEGSSPLSNPMLLFYWEVFLEGGCTIVFKTEFYFKLKVNCIIN